MYIYRHLNKIKTYIFKWVDSDKITESDALSVLQVAHDLQKKQFNKQRTLLKTSKLFVMMGTALLLSSILYFFASNWKGMTHLEKVAVVISAMLIPYILAFTIKSLSISYKKLSLFTGNFIFGIGVALIGQTYNSHADSYLLFLVWAIPTILLSIVIRYEPLYILSIILVNLSAWLYMTSYSTYIEWSSFTKMFLLNLALTTIFYLSEHFTNTGRYSKYIAFIGASLCLYLLTFSEISPQYYLITNPLFIVYILGKGIYHLRKKLDVPMVYICAAISTIYIISKYFEIVIFKFIYYGNYVFPVLILTILFSFGLLALNQYALKKST